MNNIFRLCEVLGIRIINEFNHVNPKGMILLGLQWM